MNPRRKRADRDKRLLPTVRLPGTVFTLPPTGADHEDYVEPLMKLIPKIYEDCVDMVLLRLSPHKPTEACLRRMVWFVGGCERLIDRLLSRQSDSFLHFKLFFEYAKMGPYTLVRYKELLLPDTIVGECMICLDEVTAENNASIGCNHIICFDCAKLSMESLIQVGKTTAHTLLCPGPKCEYEYNPVHVYMLFGMSENEGDRKLYEKFINFNITKLFESSPFARYCSNKSCNELIICEPGQRMIICRKCNSRTCYRCKRKYHRIPFCGSGLNVNLRTRFYYISHGARPCPRCKFVIVKNKGCNHMTCSKCHHEFCWRCGKDYFNHTVCTGATSINLDVWGPFAPLKSGFELIKDSTLWIFLVGFAVIFTWPFLLYKIFPEIKQVLKPIWEKAKRRVKKKYEAIKEYFRKKETITFVLPDDEADELMERLGYTRNNSSRFLG